MKCNLGGLKAIPKEIAPLIKAQQSLNTRYASSPLCKLPKEIRGTEAAAREAEFWYEATFGCFPGREACVEAYKSYLVKIGSDIKEQFANLNAINRY